MKQHDILNAYLTIRRIDNTIPCEVLDFMKDCAIKELLRIERDEVNTFRINYLLSKNWSKDRYIMNYMNHFKYGRRFIDEAYFLEIEKERKNKIETFRL